MTYRDVFPAHAGLIGRESFRRLHGALLFAAKDLIAPEGLREWLECAGKRIGLGD